jgi:hypothetical protein
MSLPSVDDLSHFPPFSGGYSALQSDLLTLGKFGAAVELAAFMKKHNFSSVDTAFPHAFGHAEDRWVDRCECTYMFCELLSCI